MMVVLCGFKNIDFPAKSVCFLQFQALVSLKRLVWMLQPLGLMVFQGGLAAWTQHPFEGDVQNRQDGWVGHGGTLNLPSHVFDCFLGQNQTTPRHLPQDAQETIPICCNYYCNICWNGKERSRVTSSELFNLLYRYIQPSCTHTLLGICKGLIWGLLNLSFRLLNVISSMAGCFKGVVTLLLSRLAPPG